MEYIDKLFYWSPKTKYWRFLHPNFPAKRPAPGPISISPAQKITKPAAKYGVPLTVRRPSEAFRKVPDTAKKPVKLKQVRTMGNILFANPLANVLPMHYHPLCLNIRRGIEVYCVAFRHLLMLSRCVLYMRARDLMILVPGVMCCPGSPSCSSSEESESSGGGEEEAWGTSDSAPYLHPLVQTTSLILLINPPNPAKNTLCPLVKSHFPYKP